MRPSPFFFKKKDGTSICKLCKSLVDLDKWKRHESSPGHKRRLLLLKEARKKKEQQQREAEKRARENPAPTLDRNAQLKALRADRYKELKPYLKKGQKLLRKQRLCIVQAVDFVCDPPSVTVKMIDNDAIVSAELENLELPPKEEPSKKAQQQAEKAEGDSDDDDEGLDGLPEDFFDTQFRAAQHDRHEEKRQKKAAKTNRNKQKHSKEDQDKDGSETEEITRDEVVQDSELPKRKKYGKKRKFVDKFPNRKKIKATYVERTLNREEATTAKGAQLKVPVKQKETEFDKEIQNLAKDVAKEAKRQRKDERAGQLALQKQLRRADRLDRNYEKRNIVDLRKLAEEAKRKARENKLSHAKNSKSDEADSKDAVQATTTAPVDDFDIDGLVDWKQKSWF